MSGLGPAGDRRRRAHLPRLLRRRADQHGRLRHPGDPRGGRAPARAPGIVHTSTLYLIRQQIELAEKVARVSGIPDARVFFTNSGTEANEAALLVATNHRRSNQILAVRNSYHGRSYAAMGVTGHRSWSSSLAQPAPGQLAALRRPAARPAGPPRRGRARRSRRRRPARGARHADRRRRRGADRRADPGRRRVRAPAPDGLLGALKKVLDETRHPADLRRGADRLGPHRRALLGLPGARRHAGPADLRQGHRQRLRAGRRRRPGRGA